MFFSKKKKEKIIGLLLGNLQLKKIVPPRLNSYAEYITKLDNKIFCEDLFIEFKDICMENKGLSIKTRTDRKPQIKLVTKSFKELTELRKEFYNDQGKKIIPKTIDNYISEEFLTYLYLDVGYIFNDNYIIEVTKYTIDDCRYLAQLIFQNLNLKCEVIEEKKSLKKMIILLEQKKMTQILLQILQEKFHKYNYKLIIV
jgi:hypothetical protein